MSRSQGKLYPLERFTTLNFIIDLVFFIGAGKRKATTALPSNLPAKRAKTAPKAEGSSNESQLHWSTRVTTGKSPIRSSITPIHILIMSLTAPPNYHASAARGTRNTAGKAPSKSKDEDKDEDTEMVLLDRPPTVCFFFTFAFQLFD